MKNTEGNRHLFRSSGRKIFRCFRVNGGLAGIFRLSVKNRKIFPHKLTFDAETATIVPSQSSD